MKGFRIPVSEAVWKQCTGEAHRNPFIDHCSICMPYWEVYPTCPVCGAKLEETKAQKLICRSPNHLQVLSSIPAERKPINA